jgi:hypothetical protein
VPGRCWGRAVAGFQFCKSQCESRCADTTGSAQEITQGRSNKMSVHFLSLFPFDTFATSTSLAEFLETSG